MNEYCIFTLIWNEYQTIALQINLHVGPYTKRQSQKNRYLKRTEFFIPFFVGYNQIQNQCMIIYLQCSKRDLTRGDCNVCIYNNIIVLEVILHNLYTLYSFGAL